MLKVNELFSGIGAFRKALIRLGIPHEIVGISEIDKYAIQSYEAIFGETRNYGDISKVSKLDYADLWTYGFPCQDISLAGNQAGIIKGQTRSGLLYEVQRLLGMAALYDELPKYLILENVKNLVGKKFLPAFQSWIDWLDALGYNTYWQVLNAKDYGVPQNRERVFAVSIRKDVDRGYKFPDPIPLAKTMFDALEDEVDEKYYISDAVLEQYRSSTENQGMIGNGFAFTPVEREREREKVCYADLFYESHDSPIYGEHINGFPKVRGGWCKRLKYSRETDIRKYLLSTSKNPEGGGQQDLRIPHGQGELVYERSQATGFATKWSQYCTGELKLSSITASRSQSIKGTGVQPSNSEFSDSTLAQGADINIVQYLGIAADEPERIKRHQKPDIILPLVEVGWDEAYCRQWCEENDLLSPIYTDSARGGCWFCHNQGLEQLRLLRKNYPDLWKLLLKWDKDSPVSFKPDGHTVHDYDLRFRLEDEGKVPKDRKFRWKMLQQEGDDLSLIVYDCEVFAHDWLVVFKDRNSGQYTVIHNDNAAVKEFITEDSIYCGFNSKHYDFFIIKAICTGATPEEIKELNDFIIGGGQGWEHPLIRGSYFYFNSIDIKDDMQMGLSLKAIEGHLGLSVEETTVPFDIDRPLTESELQETIHYCKHDVDTTDNLVGIRKEYLKSKIQVGRMVGISDAKAMSMTNAKLTAALLKASPVPHDDERNYSYPPNLVKDYIPPEVFEFFDQMHDPSIADKDLFKSKINFEVGGCPCVIGFGGIHGAIPTFQEEAQGKRTIRNYDVASLYPSLMIKCGYTSRNIPSAATFEEVYHTRLAAKKSGDKATANALKLVLNTTYGAMLNKYNDLFDPLMGRSVCVSGQLFLLELASRYVEKITTLRLIQLNTDGVMVSLEDWELPILTAINDEWQQRTGFLLEEDVIQKIVQKDVNNYIEIKSDGSAKTKGGYLVRGIAPAGAFNINNNAVIVAKAIREFFVNDTPVEETIGGCDDIFQFQLIAKAGAKYREAYHLVDGEQQSVQKVNRVYATSDTRYGKLFKVKAEDDATAKIEMLPEHCIIDNDNHLTIEDVDKTFYIEMAKKRINDFLGIKPEKKPRGRKTTDTPKEPRRKSKMATTAKETKSKNIYERLMAVRDGFAKVGIEKNGKNMQLTSKFFTLDDIVNKSRNLFHENRILPLDGFTKEEATLTLLDIDDPNVSIVFSIPMREYMGNAAVTPVQAMGATVTYYRRYLYSLALDLAEKDELEEGFDHAPSTPKAAPATPAQRQEVKQELTAPDGNATSLQIRQLKNILIQLREADPANDALAAKIAEQTVGFTQISKADCEKLITGLNAKLSGNTEG